MEKIVKPFDKAQENIDHLAHNLDMMNTLATLTNLLKDIKSLSPEEQEGVQIVIESAIAKLSSYLEERGEAWN